MHSAERTLSEVKVRSDWRTRWLCTAPTARIIGIAARSGPTCSSVRMTCSQPPRTASSASWRMRWIAVASAWASSGSAAKLQSITVAVRPM